jgi:hypothetical protein
MEGERGTTKKNLKTPYHRAVSSREIQKRRASRDSRREIVKRCTKNLKTRENRAVSQAGECMSRAPPPKSDRGARRRLTTSHPRRRERPLRDAVSRFLVELYPRDRIALVTMPYGGLKVDFTTDRQAVGRALSTIVGQASSDRTGAGWRTGRAGRWNR